MTGSDVKGGLEIALLATGHSLALSAYAMGLRESTIRTHLARALGKLGLRTRAELLSVAAQLGALHQGAS